MNRQYRCKSRGGGGEGEKELSLLGYKKNLTKPVILAWSDTSHFMN
jgi:hypothetical protein